MGLKKNEENYEHKKKKREEKYEGCICLERTDKAFLLSVCVSVFVLKRSPANPNNRGNPMSAGLY